MAVVCLIKIAVTYPHLNGLPRLRDSVRDPNQSNEDFNCLFAGSIDWQINRTAFVRLASFDAVLSKE